MISHSDVIAAYKEILDRVPESDDVISAHRAAHENAEAFRASLRQSPEYLAKNGVSARNPGLSAARPSSWGDSKTVTPGNLDSFITCSDSLGPPSSPQVEQFWRGMKYIPETRVNQRLDPFGEETPHSRLPYIGRSRRVTSTGR